MPRIAFADGTSRDLPDGEPLGSIVPVGAIAARFEGELVDLSFVPEADGTAESIAPGDPEGLHVLRHSSAHVMAQAVCDLWPGTRYAIGPPVEDGFYYDFDLPEQLEEEDLERIEKRMREIVQADQPFVREELSREDALQAVRGPAVQGRDHRGRRRERGRRAARPSPSTGTTAGRTCASGPHVASTGKLGAFKLL